MKKTEAIEIIEYVTKGLHRKEDFFKTPRQVIGDVLDAYSDAKKNKKNKDENTNEKN